MHFLQWEQTESFCSRKGESRYPEVPAYEKEKDLKKVFGLCAIIIYKLIVLFLWNKVQKKVKKKWTFSNLFSVRSIFIVLPTVLTGGIPTAPKPLYLITNPAASRFRVEDSQGHFALIFGAHPSMYLGKIHRYLSFVFSFFSSALQF